MQKLINGFKLISFIYTRIYRNVFKVGTRITKIFLYHGENRGIKITVIPSATSDPVRRAGIYAVASPGCTDNDTFGMTLRKLN